MGNTIRAGDLWLARIDVSMPGFLAREGTVQVKLPFHRGPLEAVVLREEIASSCLSLEAKIGQFQLEEEREEQGVLVVQVLDLKDELDRSLGVRPSKFIVARVDSSLEEEEEEMPLDKKRGLREVFASRGKGSTLKDASGS